MALWRRVKTDSERGIQIIKTRVASLGRRVIEESEMTRRRLAIRGLDGRTDEAFGRLGEKVFLFAEQGAEEFFRDREVLDLIARIETLRKERRELAEELRALEDGSA